jgi:hypothetical protein
MIKIAHVGEVKRLQYLPQEGSIVVEGIFSISGREYGETREVDEGDGGYVLIIKSGDELEHLKDIYIDVDEVIP